MGLGGQNANWKGSSANPYVEELVDTMPVVQAGLCKDYHSHLQVLHC
jgi:hypothetical protein